MFRDKTTVGSQRSFTPRDLFEHMGSLLKESKVEQSRRIKNTNYSWLRSRAMDNNYEVMELEKLKTIINKMSPESCALTAVKLDGLVHNAMAPGVIMKVIKNVLEEQQSTELLEGAVRSAKEKRGRSKRSRVYPELSAERTPTVSFILN